MWWKGYLPAHDLWVNSEDLHAPELLADFQNQSSSIRTLHIHDLSSSLPCSTTSSHPLIIKAMSTSKNNQLSTPVNVLTGMVESLFSQWLSPQDTPRAIARLVENNMTMDILSPLKIPITITLGKLPTPPNTSANLASQSSMSPLPIPPPRTYLSWRMPFRMQPCPHSH